MAPAMPAWHRQGLVVAVKEGHPWWVSHAQAPTILPLSDRLWRIYFAAREKTNRAHIVAVDVDPGDAMRVVAEHLDPLLEAGPPGTFDHEGIGPATALAVDGRVLLYYTGVTVRRDVRSQLAVGVAASADGLAFTKLFAGPIRSAGPFEPYFVSTPCVRPVPGGFRMWHASGTAWQPANGVLEPCYDIKTTRSDDGLFWEPRTETAVAVESHQQAVTRPWIAAAGGVPRMWYSRRGVAFRMPGPDAYRLMSDTVGPDGIAQGAAAPVAFINPPQPGDFDDWMQAYACIVPFGDDLIMVYNGNDFGRAGFGWARCPGGAAPGGADDRL
jgi:hypothetical protein